MARPKTPASLSRLGPARQRKIIDSARRESVKASVHGHHHALAFHPDGTLLATASGRAVVLVHLDDGCRLESLTGPSDPRTGLTAGHTDTISSLAFDPGGAHLISVGYDGALIRWTVASREPRKKNVSSDRIHSVALSPDGWTAYTVGHECVLGVVDLSGEHTTRRHPGLHLYGSAVGVSSDGQTIVSSDSAGLVRLWTPTGECRAELSHQPTPTSRTSIPYWPVSIRFRPGSPEALLACRGEEAVVLDTEALVRRHTFTGGHASYLSDALWIEEHAVVVTVAEDHCLSLWDTRRPDDEALRLTLRPHDREVATLALSPDGRTLATLDAGGQLMLWDVPTLVASMPA